MKTQSFWQATTVAGGCFVAVLACSITPSQAIGQTCPNSQPIYQPPIYQPPTQVYPPAQVQPIVSDTPYWVVPEYPSTIHPPKQGGTIHQPGCPFAGTPVQPGVIINQPGETIIVPDPNLGNPDSQIVGEIEKGPVEDTIIVQPPTPWQQWADMPPLRGDFPAMLHQVVGDVDWLLVAHGDKFSSDVKSLLSEGKVLLDTSCQVCDEDTDLFAGTDSGGETVRDVTSQIAQFRDLVGQALTQPQMQNLKQIAAPARADKKQMGKVFGSLDPQQKGQMFAFFALETLQKRADSLVSAAEAVEQGTFQPVDANIVANELKVGDTAPDFNLQTIDGNTISLSSLRGKTVALVFNRGHFCPYCMNQVKQLMNAAPSLRDQNAEIVGIFRELKPGTEVKDGIEGLRAFKQKANPTFPLAIDFGSNATSRYSTDGHFSTYVVDSDGKIAAVMKGVKYIRPSGEAIAKAVRNANSTTVGLTPSLN